MLPTSSSTLLVTLLCFALFLTLWSPWRSSFTKPLTGFGARMSMRWSLVSFSWIACVFSLSIFHVKIWRPGNNDILWDVFFWGNIEIYLHQSFIISQSCDIIGDWTPFFMENNDVIKWKHFLCYWPFVWGILQSPVDSPHKDQWRGALMFSLMSTWTNVWVNNRDASDLRRHWLHYGVTVMGGCWWPGHTKSQGISSHGVDLVLP